MKSFVAAAVSMIAILAVNVLAAPPAASNDTIPIPTTNNTNTTTAPPPAEISLHTTEKNDMHTQPPSLAPHAQKVVDHSGSVPEPTDSMSLVVYAAVLVTILAMLFLVVRNFRMRYETVRAERYGFRIRRGRTDHEVQPLARDDEDEEILFDVRGNLR